MLYATGYLEEWNAFWRQVPGQSFREDHTPDIFAAEKPLHLPAIRQLGEALAADLQELATKHPAVGFIHTLRDKMDKNIDQLNHCKNDPKRRKRMEKNIKALTSPFHRFQSELQEYHLRLGESE
ncbi:hypothetical protein [Paenibacillus cellulosilyticus]|uniref:hypothetical protein n=1 Tax=Paenibacillus cellulosilyticus TaxID=375489 RepID=UPI00158103B8|nr:hypothetical protein [Paenibacillus cellulosilyticus]